MCGGLCRGCWARRDTFITHCVYRKRNVRICAISCGDLLEEVKVKKGVGAGGRMRWSRDEYGETDLNSPY